MTPQNLAYLTEHRHFLIDAKRSQVFRNLSGEIRSNFLRIMQEEFWPGYFTDMDCGVCVMELLTRLNDKFDEWERKQTAK